jgi:hypothetical protein
MFPREVSSYKDGKLMVDKPWEEGVLKWLEKHNSCCSIYFHAKIAVYLYLLSKIMALLGTAKKPHQSFSQNTV